MDKFVFVILDKFLIIFHTFLVFFNLFGWIWKPIRKLNLISLLFVLFSWLILGIWYGIGYCPLTDLHWHIKNKIGETELPYSYIKYLIDFYLNTDVNPAVVDYITAILFICALIVSVYLNFIKVLDSKRRSY